MSIFKQFSTDANKETEGVKLTFGKNDDGTIPSVTIRRAGRTNKRYAKALEIAARPFKRQLDLKTISDEDSENILITAYAEAIVVSWEHIQDETGTEIPFNKENVISVFKKIPEFYDEIQKQANDVSLFRNETLENEAKN